MPQRVDLVSVYRHPRTGKRLTEKAAKTYNKRAKKKIKGERWLVVRHTVGDTRGLAKEQIAILKKRAGRISYAARLTTVEKILPMKSFSDRKVRQTLAQQQVYKKMWDDFKVEGDIQRRGAIRMTISGYAEGRRVKEIIHLGFHRQHWLEGYGRSADAYEGFKDWLVGAVLSNLRRRGLRLSNPKESARRINDLSKNRQGMLSMMEMETKPEKRGGWLERIKWATDAIRQQKKSRQVTQATIKIEKLI